MQLSFLKSILLLSALVLSPTLILCAEQPRPTEPSAAAQPALVPMGAREIERTIHADPLFKDLTITIDVYKGLVLVHGAAPNESLITLLNEELSAMPGVAAVYNYMTSPERALGESPVSVTYENLGQAQEAGQMDNAVVLAARVKDRLAAEPTLTPFNFEIDSYLGLIILHGTVSSPVLAERAKQIAVHTMGVDDVLSFLDVGVSGPELHGAPLYVPPVLTPPAPPQFTPSCKCDK